MGRRLRHRRRSQSRPRRSADQSPTRRIHRTLGPGRIRPRAISSTGSRLPSRCPRSDRTGRAGTTGCGSRRTRSNSSFPATPWNGPSALVRSVLSRGSVDTCPTEGVPGRGGTQPPAVGVLPRGCLHGCSAIGAETVAVLRRHRVEQDRECEVLGEAWKGDPDGYVFTTA